MITIRHIQELKEIDHYSPLEKAIHTICIVDGRDIDEVEEMKVYDLFNRFNTIMDNLKFEDTIQLRFKIKGRRFRMIPNAMEMQGQHFISLQQFNSDDTLPNLHRIMAMMSEEVNIFGRPKKIKNLGVQFEEVSNLFLHLPYQIAYGYTLFFSRLYPKLLDATQTYLSQMVESLKAKAMEYKDGLNS
jgi:hypothetical protein